MLTPRTWRFLKSISLVTFFGLLTSIVATGQVSGVITDSSGEPLIGVNIYVPANGSGTITDFEGAFTINAQPDDILEVSYIGFQTIEVKASQAGTITLSEESELLDEIVVVGYGAVDKDDLTGVVTKVDEKDFIQGSITSPEKLLNGKVAGLQISNSGEPGGGSRIRLRGSTSLTAESSPLIVCLLYTSPSPRDATLSRMPSSA